MRGASQLLDSRQSVKDGAESELGCHRWLAWPDDVSRAEDGFVSLSTAWSYARGTSTAAQTRAASLYVLPPPAWALVLCCVI
jgi:hypothetical protein